MKTLKLIAILLLAVALRLPAQTISGVVWSAQHPATTLGADGGVAQGVPLALPGVLYPSNTWNWAAITNRLSPGDIVTVNSNGLTLVDVWRSNGVPVLKPRW